MTEKACKNCKYIYEGEKCPICGSTEAVTNFAGYIIVLNPEDSEIAKKAGINVPGKYAARLRR